jgi:haloacid dehalogenase superfamily, subfamily IA, variant 3 with third motif having DD or ED/haloacid dehalogenase superfamily, subfamily IA, variant 1 with third motif having Dx(3-4)D or Dx(3-4)E
VTIQRPTIGALGVLAAARIEIPGGFPYTYLVKKSMNKNIKAVLFDVDETLFDRVWAQKAVLALIVQQLPQVFSTFPPERVLAAFLKSDQIYTDMFNSGAASEGSRDKRSLLFLQLLGIDEKYTATISELYVRDYPAVQAHVDGAIPVVKELSHKFKLGVVSNGFTDVQYRKLENMGLRDLFSCVVLSEEFGIRKPDSRIFHRAATLLHMQPQECLYVGDSYANDVIGAKNAGMQACWLNRDAQKIPDEKIKPDLVITKLAELPGLLEK